MLDILEFVFSGFWVFLGFEALLSMVLYFIFVVWNRFMRMIMVRKHGWPPEHLDADGDWSAESE